LKIVYAIVQLVHVCYTGKIVNQLYGTPVILTASVTNVTGYNLSLCT